MEGYKKDSAALKVLKSTVVSIILKFNFLNAVHILYISEFIFKSITHYN